jgi:hypothetical protein
MPETEKPKRKSLDEVAREVKASLPDDPVQPEPFEEDILGVAPDRPGVQELPLAAQPKDSPAAAVTEPKPTTEPTATAPAAVTPAATVVAPEGATPPAGSVEAAPGETPPAGYVAVEYRDEDTGETYTVFAKESIASNVKNGYARKSSWSRATGYLGKYRADLEPLITGGQGDDIVNMLRMARGNPAFGRHLYEAYTRAASGQPLTWADVQAQAAAAQPAAVAEPTAPVLPEGDEDVFGLGGAIRPIYERMDKIANTQADIDRRLTEDQNRQAAAIQAQQNMYRLDAAVKAEMRAYFPAEFTGTVADEDKLARAVNYAKESGMFAKYGLVDWQGQFKPEMLPQVPAIVRLAKMELDNVGYDATPSRASSVVGIAEADAMATRAAREAARQVAVGAGGGSNAAPTPAPLRLVAPPTRDSKGRMIPIDKYTKSQEYKDYVKALNAGKKAGTG